MCPDINLGPCCHRTQRANQRRFHQFHRHPSFALQAPGDYAIRAIFPIVHCPEDRAKRGKGLSSTHSQREHLRIIGDGNQVFAPTIAGSDLVLPNLNFDIVTPGCTGGGDITCAFVNFQELVKTPEPYACRPSSALWQAKNAVTFAACRLASICRLESP